MALAVLGLCGRIAAAMAMPAMPAPATLDALLGVEICHADGGTPEQPAAPGHLHDCELCPACLSLVAVLPQAAPAQSAAARVESVRYLLPPPAAGPPASRFTLAAPRGPPAPV